MGFFLNKRFKHIKAEKFKELQKLKRLRFPRHVHVIYEL